MAPRISVGIMVKNQAKELRECLERLADTRARVDTEIIVHIDDSTTENTYAVAKEFTQNVRYFKWIDDYSAIKNGIMEEATGEWIWILDADEFACDTAPLINFIDSEEAKKYSVLQYYERNFTDKGRTYSTLQYAPRIYRATANHRYKNKVHEVVDTSEQQLKLVEMYVDHIGYVDYATSEKKKLRDMQTKEEYDKNPSDLRNVCTYAGTFLLSVQEERSKLIEVLKKGTKIARKMPDMNFSGNLYFKLAQVYCINGDMQRAEEALIEYEKIWQYTTFSMGEIYIMLAKSFAVQKKYEQAIKYYEKYFMAYQKAEKGTICDIDQNVGEYSELILNGNNVKENIIEYAIALAQTSKFEKAKEQLLRKEINDYDGTALYSTYFLISQKCGDAKLLAGKYLEMYKNGRSLENIRNTVESILIKTSFQEMNFEIVRELAALKSVLCDDIYIQFNGVRTDTPLENAEVLLQEIANSSSPWAQTAFIFILNKVLTDKIPMGQIAKEGVVNKLSTSASAVFMLNNNYKKLLLDYLEKYNMDKSLQELRIKKEMMTPVVARSFADGNIDIDFFKVYMCVMGEYATATVPQSFLEGENLNCLSQELQIGVKMQWAINAKTTGDMVQYVKCLKEIIKLDFGTVTAISVLIKEIKESCEEPKEITGEMKVLAESVKAMLQQFIDRKDKVNALAIFQKLKEIVPSDSELPQIVIKINNI